MSEMSLQDLLQKSCSRLDAAHRKVFLSEINEIVFLSVYLVDGVAYTFQFHRPPHFLLIYSSQP